MNIITSFIIPFCFGFIIDRAGRNGDCFVVTRIYQPLVDKRCNGIAKDGSVYMDVVCDRLIKTGRHFDIASILEEMRE